MAQYRVLEKSFIGGRIIEAGEIVEYDGEAAGNLEPIKKGKGKAAQDDVDSASSDASGEKGLV